MILMKFLSIEIKFTLRILVIFQSDSLQAIVLFKRLSISIQKRYADICYIEEKQQIHKISDYH